MVARARWLIYVCALLLAGADWLRAQSKRPEDLATGKVLVIRRDAPDPHFSESVILLVQHDEKGAVGLMLNRRTTMPISSALRELPTAVGHSDPVFVGGPVQLETVFALARAPRKPEGAAEVAGDIYLLAARPALEKALRGPSSPSALRVYLGYCGWGPRQLENEVSHGGWYIFDRREDVTFDTDPTTLWSRLIAKAEAQMAWRGFVVPVR
jgi:putative transcriptional regulator